MSKAKTVAMGWSPLLGGVAGGTLLFLVYQYGKALWSLANRTGGMDNKFSQLAQSEYLSYLVGQNVVVLLAYLILWIAAILLVTPLVSLIRRWLPWQGKGAIALAALILTALIHSYFETRLEYNRPYFLGGGEQRGMIYLLPDAWQATAKTVVFTAFPLLASATLAAWWLMKMKPRLRAGVIVAGLLVSAAFAFAPARHKAEATATAPNGKALNVIIVGSDSLRGDRLGFAGYKPSRSDGAAAAGVSPNIDNWAKDAVRFERCYVPMASTLESAVSVMSSTYPHTNGIRHMYPGKEQVEATQAKVRPIAAVLSEKGYDTAAIGDWCAGFYEMMPLGFNEKLVSTFENFRIYMTQAVFMAHFVVPLYFDNPLGYKLFPQITSFAEFVTPEVVTKRVEDKLADQAKTGRPFFWHVFYSCNHLPYNCGQPYNRLFTDPAYKGRNLAKVDFDINEFVSGTSLEDKMSALPEADIRQVRALYDGCTRQFDDCFGRIQAALKKNGLAENTIVIVTADHGDDLYEPGVTLTHGLGFNGGDHCFHIPMALHVPGATPASLPDQIRSIDLSPTLLDLLGVEKPTQWEGKSFAGRIHGTAPQEDRPYYGETSFPFIQFKVPGVDRPKLPPMDELTMIDPSFKHQFVMKPEFNEPVNIAKQRCLRTRNWKVVCTPCSEGNRHYGLFRISTDPDCRDDLSGHMPEILHPMQAALERWMDRHEETPIAEIFPGGEP